MLIAFWTIAHGQTANTVNTAAVGAMIALNHHLKTLVCHSQFSSSILEKCFISDRFLEGDTLDTFSDRGLDAVVRLAKNKKLEPKIMGDYTISLLKDNRLDLLTGTELKDKNIFSNTVEVLQPILECAKGFYDVVAMDVHSGIHNKMTNAILEKADLIIVNLNQNIYLLNDFFNNKKIKDFIMDRNFMINISKYDKRSKYTLKNISRKFGIKDIVSIPYDVGFMDACNSHLLLDFLIRNNLSQRKNEQYEFIHQLNLTTKKILERVGYKEGEVEWVQS
jgi:hypothetical protein